MTIEAIAQNIVTNYTDEVAKFINSKASKLYTASYSSGQYGRLYLPLIKMFYSNLNLNGHSTSIGLAITRLMEDMGYTWDWSEAKQSMEFTQTRKI